MQRIQLLLLIGLLLFCLPSQGMAFGGMANEPEAKKSAPALPEDYSVRLRVPVSSELFIRTPVALVGDQPVLMGELTQKLLAGGKAEPTGPAYIEVLDSLIKERVGQNAGAKTVVYVERSIGGDRTLVLQAPIFSPQFIFTPVASVAGEPIYMGEFSRELGAMHADADSAVDGGASPDNPGELLERLLAVRLVEQEARNMGLDQQGMVQRQVADFAEKTLLYDLLGRRVGELVLDRKAADKIYHEISLAAKLDNYRFQRKENGVAFLKQLDEGADFAPLIKKEVAEGRAIGEEEEGFVPLKKLRDEVASAANTMKIGEVSRLYGVADGFVVFRLDDRKFIEDPAALEMAEKLTWDQQVAKQSREYMAQVIEQYADYNQEAKKDFNFTQVQSEHPDFQLSDALKKFAGDQRTLVTVRAGEQTRSMKVSELVEKLKATYFHGTEIELNAGEADKRAAQILEDWIFRIAGKAEAKKMGLDQSRRYQIKIADFERRTLFDHFMQKVIVPEVKLAEDEIRQYYDDHIEDYSTPRMLKMKSLAFYDRKKAASALNKLKKGSDFNWVSANSEGLVAVEDEDLLSFGSGILSVTTLPEGLRAKAEQAVTGDALIYSDPGSFHYVLHLEKNFPPEPKPYDQVRSQILKLVYQERVQEALDAFVAQLKEHYPTEIYLEVGKN